MVGHVLNGNITTENTVYVIKYSTYIKWIIKTITHRYCYINTYVWVITKLIIRPPDVFFYFWYEDHFFRMLYYLGQCIWHIYRYKNDDLRKIFYINVLINCFLYKIKMEYCNSRLQLFQDAEVSRQYLKKKNL